MSLACWAGSQWLGAVRARLVWTTGCAANLAHVLLAFALIHHWNHMAAHTAVRIQTFEQTGIDSGIGLYINYAFTALWLIDTGLWWLRPTATRTVSRAQRNNPIHLSLHVF